MVTLHPQTIPEALDAMRAGAEAVAGGTDWMIERAAGDAAVFIGRIPAMRRVTETAFGVDIGACVTYDEIEHDARIPRILRDAAGSVAAPAIRNRGTLGGNIVNASPAGDMLPALYMLDAVVALTGRGDTRSMKVAAFITGVKQTRLRRGEELLTAVHIPRTEGFMRFDKAGARCAQAISKCSLAACLRVTDGEVADFRAAFGAVGRTVVRDRDIERMLIGRTPREAGEAIGLIRDAYAAVLSPIDDARSTAEYRKETCLRLLEAFVRDGLAQQGGAG